MDNPFNPTSPREVVALCRRYGLHPRRSLGQHFLVDGNIAARIIEGACLREGDAVVEVGPGTGALTLNLAFQESIPVTAVEIDSGLIRLLQDLCRTFPRVTIVHADALSLDWPAFLTEQCRGANRVVLLSNLPYNISSPLLYRLFSLGFPFGTAVLMLQKEVARRLITAPGAPDYGSLSVICGYYTRAEMLFTVSRNVFWPKPAVDSAVVRLLPRPASLSRGEEALFWKVVRGVFQHRRKMIANSLAPLLPGGREEAGEALGRAGLAEERRPESLSVDEFANLCRVIYNDSNRV